MDREEHFTVMLKKIFKKIGLSFEGLESNTQMWEHYCPMENDIIGTEKGQPCNWCDATEISNKNKER